MQNIQVHRYSNPEMRKHYQGWIEPDDYSWIVFVDAKGRSKIYDKRDPVTGAVVE